MKKKIQNYIITKRKDGVDIHLSDDAYSHLHKELKCMLEAFCKEGVTLLEIGNACPIAMMLMASHEVVVDLNVGDRIIDKKMF